MSDGQPYPRGIGHPKSHYILQQLFYHILQLILELAGLSIFHLWCSACSL